MNKKLIYFVVLAVGGVAASLEPYTRSHAMGEMQEELNGVITAIEKQHKRAKDDLAYSLTHSAVKNYFALEETQKGNEYRDGVLQFSRDQRFYKNHIDTWIMAVMKPFNVGEACLIDGSGQEHARITDGEIAPDSDLSATESSADFFERSAALGPGEIHVNYPYMSADINQWVFSYTSPVQLDDGSTPAFLHFELPISYFQELTTRSSGSRVLVIDPQGFLIADSNQPIDINRREFPEGHAHGGSEDLRAYMPELDTVSSDPSFIEMVAEMHQNDSGSGSYQTDGKDFHVVYQKLPTFDWVIAEIKDDAQILKGGVIDYWMNSDASASWDLNKIQTSAAPSASY